MKSYKKNFFSAKGQKDLIQQTVKAISPSQISQQSFLDDLNISFQKDLNVFVQQAYEDGRQGIPKADSLLLSETESSMNECYFSTQTQVKQGFEKKRLNVKNQIAEFDLEKNHSMPKSFLDEKLKKDKEKAVYQAEKLKPSLMARLFGAFQLYEFDISFAAKKKRLEELQRQREESRDHREIKLQKILREDYGGIPPIRKWSNFALLFWIVISGLWVFECWMNFSAFQNANVGSSNGASILLGVFLAAIQALSALELGTAWRKKKWIIATTHLIFTLFLCLYIGGFRWQMELGNGLIVKMALASINVLIAIVMVSFAHSRQEYHEYFTVLRKRNKANLKFESLDSKIEQLQKDQKAKLDNALWEVDRQDKLQIQQNQLKHAKHKLHLATQLEKIENEQIKRLNELKEIYQKAITDYQSINQSMRKRAGKELVQRWISGSEIPQNGLSSLSKAVCFLLLLAMGLSSCSPDEMPLHVEVIYDVTGKTLGADVEAMTHYVIEEMGLREGASHWPEIHVNVSQITHQSTPVIHQIHLEKSKGFLGRNEKEHEKALAAFEEELKVKIETITAPSDELEHSYIHRNMHHRLSYLAQQNGHKVALCWSDLIHNHAPVNLYDYELREHEIIEHKDSLIHLMSLGYEFPNLHGIHVINHHHPSKLRDELHEAGKHLFHHQLTQKDASVEFRTGMQHHAKTASLSASTGEDSTNH